MSKTSVFSSKYPIKKISDVCMVIAGQSPESKYYNSDGKGLPFYQGKKEFTKKYLGKPTIWTSKITKEAQEDDILMSVRAPVGPVNFATQKICIGRGLAAIRSSEKANKNYLFYFFLMFESKIEGNNGAIFDSINKDQIGKIEVPLPTLSEQKHIVAILDDAFTAIDQTKANIEKNIENTRELFQNRLNEIFSHKGEGWEEKRLSDVCIGFQYGTSSKSNPTGKIPVLRMGNLQDGEIDWSDLQFTSNSVDIEKYLLEKDDVLFNRTNSAELVGKSAIYKGEQDAIFAGYLIRILRNKDLLDGGFLNFYLMSPQVREYGFSVMSSSVHQANISASKLKNYKIFLPSIVIQRKIVDNILLLNREITKIEESYNSKLSTLEQLKNSLLQKAFAGELT